MYGQIKTIHLIPRLQTLPFPKPAHLQWAQDQGAVAKDLIDSEDPKHTLFCREIAFVAIYAFFWDDISIF